MKNTGIYIRAYKDNKWQPILLEQLPEEDQETWYKDFDNNQLKIIIKQFSKALKVYQDEYNDYEEDFDEDIEESED